MIKVNNKSGGPDTRHLITRHQPTSGMYPIHRFNGNNKPTYHGLGNPTQNRPCPFVSWSKDHKVKAPTKSGPTIGLVNQPIPKHTTNGSLPTPPINTTNIVAVEGQNQTTTERQRTQITYLTQPKNNP